MAWPYEAYVTLITDLLSPHDLPEGSLASIARHIGSVEDAGLGRLVSAMQLSPTLYGMVPQQQASSSRKLFDAVDLSAAQNVFHAVRQGMDTRIQDITRSKGNTWSKRRRLQKAIATIQAANAVGQGDVGLATSAKCLVISTATLRGIQDNAARKGAIFNTDSNLLRICERHAFNCILEHLRYLPAIVPEQLPDDNSLLLAWLVAQVLPEIPSERLRSLADPAFFDFAFSYTRASFLDGRLLASIAYDVRDSEEGIIWPDDSPSSRCLKSVKQSPSQLLLGRFSRSLGKVIESVASMDLFVILLPQFERLQDLAHNVQRDWGRCFWSNAAGIEDLHPDTRKRDEPWTIFKTLLFTMTMVFSSLISLMNAMPLSPHRTPDKSIIDLASCTLRTFSSIYFITSKFGTNGFGAYQNVWYGAVDIVSRASPAKIEQIAKTCQPEFDADQRRDTVLSAVVARSRMTYWLNLVEQLVQPIPEDYLSVTVIPALRPYLTDPQDTEAFESAHSVLLAIFDHKKELAIEVSAWYSDLLLESYPERLSITQLRLAYATMVGCLTDLAGGDADVCIKKLLRAIENQPPGPSGVKSPDLPLAEVSESRAGSSLASQDIETSAKRLETAALRSRRGHLLLVLIDQLSAVHLEAMERLLPTIQSLIREARKAPWESRRALIQVLFNTLSGAMDMIKRETAAQWWLEHRAEIEGDENEKEEEGLAHFQEVKSLDPLAAARL